MTEIINEPWRTYALRLRAALYSMRFSVETGGQLRDRNGILWSPTDAEDWDRGGAGDLAPNLDDHLTISALVGMLVERGWRVTSWRVSHLAVAADSGTSHGGAPYAVIVAAFGHMDACGHKEPRT